MNKKTETVIWYFLILTFFIAPIVIPIATGKLLLYLDPFIESHPAIKKIVYPPLPPPVTKNTLNARYMATGKW